MAALYLHDHAAAFLHGQNKIFCPYRIEKSALRINYTEPSLHVNIEEKWRVELSQNF